MTPRRIPEELMLLLLRGVRVVVVVVVVLVRISPFLRLRDGFGNVNSVGTCGRTFSRPTGVRRWSTIGLHCIYCPSSRYDDRGEKSERRLQSQRCTAYNTPAPT